MGISLSKARTLGKYIECEGHRERIGGTRFGRENVLECKAEKRRREQTISSDFEFQSIGNMQSLKNLNKETFCVL